MAQWGASLPQALPLDLTRSSRGRAASLRLPRPGSGSTTRAGQPRRAHTHKEQPRLCDRPHFIWSFPPKRLPAEPHDMCKSPPESWASQCVKKAPPGGRAVQLLKKKREKSVPQKAWLGSQSPRARTCAQLPLGTLSLLTVLRFPSRNALGLWPLEGLDAVLSG